MAVTLSPVAGVAGQFFDNNGNPLVGGKLYTYTAGTTTPQASYTSAAGGTAHANPIVLDAGGRVPGGEIWLADGLQYKFVLKTSTDTLIGTYDNVVGINSNFVNFTNQQEIQTATASQTVFTLATVTYSPGTNSLSVFVDGVNQYGPGATYAYLETDSTTITFLTGLHVGASVKFTTSQLNSGASAVTADTISYTPAGTGAVATTVQAKLRESVSVLDFGAVGDGTTDDTVAVQAAVDFLVTKGGGQLYFPASSTAYILRSVDLYSNIYVVGDGWGSHLKMLPGYLGRLATGDITYPHEVDGMFVTNFAGAGSSSVSGNIQNIKVCDLWLEGNSVAGGFLETLNLLCLTGVSNVDVSGCKFTAFQGDAFVNPTDFVTTGSFERTCTNLHIHDNVFDGVNYANRQAISLISCVGAVIEGNYFTRTTDAAMPGAIDLEPGGAINPQMLGITIRSNVFDNLGASGTKPAVAVLLPPITDKAKFGGISIEDNTISSCLGLQINGTVSANQTELENVVSVNNNSFMNTTRGIVTSNFFGLNVTKNLFYNATDTMLLGVSGEVGNILFDDNRFTRCGSTSGTLALVYATAGLTIRNNKFLDCGKSDGTKGDVFDIQSGSVTDMTVSSNKFWDKNGVMKQVIRNTGAGLALASTTLSDNQFVGSVVMGYSQKKSSFGTYLAAPTATAVTLFALEEGMYQVAVDVVGDAANYGAFATVVVGAGTARIVANNTGFVTITLSAMNLQATQSSGSPAPITWSYTKTQKV